LGTFCSTALDEALTVSNELGMRPLMEGVSHPLIHVQRLHLSSFSKGQYHMPEVRLFFQEVRNIGIVSLDIHQQVRIFRPMTPKIEAS